MANTFSQIYIQTVFAVNGRLSLIQQDFKEDLYKYITGIVRNQGQKLISINGMSDHLHILIGLKPAMALADLVRDIKSDSSDWVNRKKLARQIRMARRLRSILLRTFTAGYNHPVHTEPGEASSTPIV
jgi:putative transposase